MLRHNIVRKISVETKMLGVSCYIFEWQFFAVVYMMGSLANETVDRRIMSGTFNL